MDLGLDRIGRLTSTTPAVIASIVVTARDWDVTGNVPFSPAGGTITSAISVGLSLSGSFVGNPGRVSIGARLADADAEPSSPLSRATLFGCTWDRQRPSFCKLRRISAAAQSQGHLHGRAPDGELTMSATTTTSATLTTALQQALTPKTGMQRIPFPLQSYEHPSPR